ncbi:MAG: N(6)-L-threonylcarbamoyladenine synthase Kae1 [Candidatus Lokiarchaeota archaeon]|nr:N(6)-L-threonylcarbamoyladenine synthase Kae1 [Candidatus Lokiarchaeota archaeon]MBD3199095.1 N(6)-L-threonylcarbamoyladenine synthase Kae1 [Candidatus Lokiarchaeota archaeon]
MKKNSKYCLGIETTAHTFGVGIVDFEGNVYSRINDIFTPESGGLHPMLVKEQHLANFHKTILKALKEANLSIHNINLVAFSQSPGLGPVLRIGALVSRLLSQKLNIPIVGVNHCIAHIEIGRLKCQIEDPLTLYVSGGNTIVSAFESGRYQIFGETLDLAIGNMIDSFARDVGIAHPGGPKIEKLAKESKHYLSLPYSVKGMDLSFSGLYTAARRLIESKEFNSKYNLSDVAFSLQETAFAMLTEVTERALAHTQKKEVLLTGGVAANERLQEMIEYISMEHDAHFEVVPLRYAGDNGAMIAWTGVLKYLHNGEDEIKHTIIQPKQRMDNIEIPWRE